MVDVILLGQLVNSMDDAVSSLETVVKKKKKDEIHRLRLLILELHEKLEEALDAR